MWFAVVIAPGLYFSLDFRGEAHELLVVAGKNLPLEKVSNLVAPHFAVVVRGKEGTKINRTVPLPSCLFKATGNDIQVVSFGAIAIF